MTAFNCDKVLRALLFGTLLFLGCSKSTEPVDEDFSDRAAYVLVVRAGEYLYMMRGDGTNPELLVEGYWPVVSPDGRRLAFRTNPSLHYVYDLSSKQSRQLLPYDTWDRYAWSPASDRIVFCGFKGASGYAIRIISLASGAVDSLTDSLAGKQRYPHWLPDSVTIAYLQISDASQTLCTFSLRDGAVTNTQVALSFSGLQWSPNGKMLFAGGHIVAWPSLAVIKVFPGTLGNVSYCKWFPDNTRLLLRTASSTYLFDIETNSSAWISDEQPTQAAFTVSADGKLIGYIPAPGDHLVVMNSDGQRKASLTIPGVSSYTEMQFAGDTTW
jgi:hypothetical protein